MGLPPKESKTFEEKYQSASNGFYPSTVTIGEGDSVSFVPLGFHNVHLPKQGGKPIPALVPTGTASGVVDAAGKPFWFNGQPTLGFNPPLLKSGFGKRFTYTGAKAVQSGLPLAPKPKPMRVKFGKAGTFTYYCDLHTGMKGKVKVVPAGAPVPTAKADAAAVKRQIAADTKRVKAIGNLDVPDNTVQLGAADKDVEFFGIVPAKLTVPVGTTVEFRMGRGSREPHTATFGPGNPLREPTSYLGVLASAFEKPGAIDGRSTYPSDPPPAGVATLTPALHGNGFWNSGVLDAEAPTPPPVSAKVTFGQAGTYPYYCLIHPFMAAEVIVQ